MNALDTIVYPAIDDVNDLMDEQEIPKDPSAKLFGEGAVLDSLNLVKLILAVEDKIDEQCGLAVTLANEKAMSRSHSPFRTIGTLAGYVEELIREEQADG